MIEVFDLGVVIFRRAKKEAELEKRFSGLYMEKEEAARQEEARKAAALEKSRQEDLKVLRVIMLIITKGLHTLKCFGLLYQLLQICSASKLKS